VKSRVISLVLGVVLATTLVTNTYAAWAAALGKSGDPIVAWGYNTTYEAKRAALKECNKVFADCEIMAIGHLCLFLANGGTKWGAGSGWHQEANEEALAACTAAGGRACKVVHRNCE
jgi:hypothetical protein